MKPLVLDFTGSQLRLARKTGAEVLDFSGLGECRRYCSPESEKRIADALAGRTRGVHFLDSGDYHYISKIFTDALREPFELLLIDHHPDMQEPSLGNLLSCGGWVRTMLEDNQFLAKVTIVGIDPALAGETAGFGGKLAVFCEGDTVLPHKSMLPLYISIDKDALCSCQARTNWDQGSLTIPDAVSIVTMLASGRRVLGADICGAMPFPEGGTPEDEQLNIYADTRLLEMLEGLSPAI